MTRWTSSFEDAEERLLDLSLEATPEQRLEWLEEAQHFALECRATIGTPFEPATDDDPRLDRSPETDPAPNDS